MHTIESVKNAIDMAERGESNCDNDCIGVSRDTPTVQTGPATRRLLNNLLAAGEQTYLEVGMYYGNSFAAAINGNKFKCAYGIDSLIVGPSSALKESILEKIKQWHTPSNGMVVTFFEDCFKFDVSRIPDPITVYMYDADHTKEGHRKGITHFWPCLADRFVLIVDDWNWEDVRKGTEIGLGEVNSKILFNTTLLNMDKYYNGLSVWLIEK